MQPLRFATAGSVDDGKSTLIGRLLYDARAIQEDQLAAVERASQRRGAEGIDLSLLTDDVNHRRVTQGTFRAAVASLVGARFAGVLLAPLLFLPSAFLIA